MRKTALMILILFLLSNGLYTCGSLDLGNSSGGEKISDIDEGEKEKQREAQWMDWTKNSVIYEVNVRQYTSEGTFEAFEKHLPRLKELGVDILWFMPIHPISKKKRAGTLGSYYAVQDYRAVNPEFGTLEDFKNLVKRAHDMGFKVLMDWVANHTGWDHVWMENPDWYTRDENGNIIKPPGTNWEDVADLNYNNREMRAAMIESMKFWVEECDVDGFRADYAGGVPVDFWEEARREIEKIKPVFMLAEDDHTYELLEKAFDCNYGWGLYNIMNDIARGRKDASTIKSYFEKVGKKYPSGTYPMHFITNHDENSWNGTEYERLGDAVEAMAVLTFTVPGIPLIYSGQEVGLNKRLKFFDKDQILWNNLNMQEFYKALIRLKKENEALWNGDEGGPIEFLETSYRKVLAFKREKDQNKVIVVINLSDKEQTATVETGLHEKGFREYFTGAEFDLTGEMTIKLEPWSYIVLVK